MSVTKQFLFKSKGYGYFGYFAHSKEIENEGLLSKTNLAVYPPRFINPDEISIIIPVRNNQCGIEKFLEGFFKNISFKQYPSEIIIIDNNSFKPVSIPQKYIHQGISIKVLKCLALGPGAARNCGIKEASSKWVLLTDSDCIPTPNFISGYLTEVNHSIALMGNILPFGKGAIVEYYNTQNIFSPPSNNENAPQYLITSNTLILKKAFELAGGFDESFGRRGCEDIELSLKLKKYGHFSFKKNSTVFHDTGNTLRSFVSRFVKYGKGLNVLNSIHNVKPRLAFPNRRILVNYILCLLHYLSLLLSYKSIKI